MFLFLRPSPTAALLRPNPSSAAAAAPNVRLMSASAAADSNPPASPATNVRVKIKGRVQGVFFRDWTVQNARELGLRGWVRNRRDGSVEAVFSGDPDAVQDMVERRCRVGPPAATVTGIASFPWNEDPGQGFQRRPTV
ncbi:acylphosphatase [Apostasia shenzhenica]|uniref:Acylphosphatase n=1 Tax=Apostasia shenzhenica TaxID=1088818 RepID=A0A2I0B4K3_9ASPA|nr:acylphosphatase [Apostasia shenzhenica]